MVSKALKHYIALFAKGLQGNGYFNLVRIFTNILWGKKSSILEKTKQTVLAPLALKHANILSTHI